MVHARLQPILLATAALLGAPPSNARGQSDFVSAWGDNFHGQIQVPPGLSGIRQVACGYNHTYALRLDGTLIGWGTNVNGQLNTPANLNDVRQVACGLYATYVVRHDGSIRGWGSVSSSNPASSGMTQVSCGRDHHYALRADGTLLSWGFNGDGQRATPAGLSSVTQVACGAVHTYALKNDGSLSGWGNNDYGQVNTPESVLPITQVACGLFHNCALRSDGSVVGWGFNDYGQVQIPASVTDAVGLACGFGHSCAILRDGTVMGWGFNGYQQAKAPPNLEGFTQISCGYFHTSAIRGFLDCDSNGVDDGYQATLTETWDLNGDRALDVCQGGAGFDMISTDLGVPQAGQALSWTFTNLPQIPAAAPQLIIEARGDLDASNEFITVQLDGLVFGRVFETGGAACSNGVSRAIIAIPRVQWEVESWDRLTADDALEVTLTPSAAVEALDCDGSVTVRLRYLAGDDCDNEGTMDGFQIAAGVPDENANLRIDLCERRKGDLDLSGAIDFGDVAMVMLLFGEENVEVGDIDGSGRVDFGDVAMLLLDFGPVQWP